LIYLDILFHLFIDVPFEFAKPWAEHLAKNKVIWKERAAKGLGEHPNHYATDAVDLCFENRFLRVISRKLLPHFIIMTTQYQ
jgi:hypothetical protein